MKNESDRARFFVHYGGPNLFEDTIGYKKRELLCNFFILVCSGCPWLSKAFEVAERSEAGALMDNQLLQKYYFFLADIDILLYLCSRFITHSYTSP